MEQRKSVRTNDFNKLFINIKFRGLPTNEDVGFLSFLVVIENPSHWVNLVNIRYRNLK